MKFFHRIAGAKFFMPDGREVCFAGGVVDTSTISPEHRFAVESELKKIANTPSSQIYTMEKPVIAVEETAVRREIMKDATVAFDGANKITAPTETVPMPVAPDQVPPVSVAVGGAETGSGDALQSRLAAAKAAISNVSKGTVSASPTAQDQNKA